MNFPEIDSQALIVYLHFNYHKKIDDYVFYQLDELKKVGNIIFVSNSEMAEIYEKKLLEKPYCEQVIKLDNRGYDFGGWKQAINILGDEYMEQYQYLVLMNDSCFGPIYDFFPIWKEMNKKSSDFWGISSNKDSDDQALSQTHIQSYFMVFTRKVFVCETFKNFFDEYSLDIKTKEEAILHGEAVLTAVLEKAGFTKASYTDLSDLEHIFTFPEFLNFKNKKSPFLKRYFVSPPGNFEDPYILTSGLSTRMRYLNERTNYPVKLIKKFVDNNVSPETDLCVRDKSTDFSNIVNNKDKLNLNLAIYVEKSTIEIYEELMFYLKETGYKFDFYISSLDSMFNVSQAAEVQKKYACDSVVGNIIVTNESEAGGFYYWKSKLSQYDFVLHLSMHGALNYTHRRFLLNSLIFRIDELLGSFIEHDCIGIIYPQLSKTTLMALINNQVKEEQKVGGRFRNFCASEDQLNLNWRKDLGLLSVWQMFWYRPDAFKSYFEVDLGGEEEENKGHYRRAFEKFGAQIAKRSGFTYSILYEPEATSVYLKDLYDSFRSSTVEPNLKNLLFALLKGIKTKLFHR